MDPLERVARQYEVDTGFGIGDRVQLSPLMIPSPEVQGIIIGVEVDLRERDDEEGRLVSDPCFRVRLDTGSIVYATVEDFESGLR